MTRIVIAEAVRADLARISDHLLSYDVANVGPHLTGLLSALRVLGTSPEIGRPLLNGLRELIIGKGARGYVALYRVDAETGDVRVLRIRAQRERGYPD